MVTVAAIVVTYNAEDQIEPCLDALSHLPLEQIRILDNASVDRTIPIVEMAAENLRRQGARLDWLRSPVNVGFGAGVNAAASGLEGEALLLVNPDCVLPTTTFDRMREYLGTHAEVSAVGPGMIDPAGYRQIAGGAWPTMAKEIVSLLRLDSLVPVGLRPRLGRWLRRPLPSLASYLETVVDHGPVTVDWLSGFCLLVRTSAWHQAGGFDPSFFLYYEDVDLCRRLSLLGGHMVCLTDVVATHIGSASSSKAAKRRRLAGGRRSYFEKHGSPAQRVAARLLGAA